MMNLLLNKKNIESNDGSENELLAVRHGDTRLFLFIDRRSKNKAIRKAFYFVREFRGSKLRIKIGDVSNWSVSEAEKRVKTYDVMCDSGQDPREVKFNEAKASEERQIIKRAASVKLGEVWHAYLSARQKDIRPLKPLTVRDYLRHIEKSLASWENYPLSKLNENLIKLEYPLLVERIGVAQANQAMRSLRAVLNWVIDSGEYVSALISNPVNILKRKTHKVKPRQNNLEKGQISSWWVASADIGNETAQLYLRFLLLTGARRDEALTLRWCDVDLHWDTCKFCDTKNSEDRIIPLTKFVKESLMRLPRMNEWVFASLNSRSGHMVEPAKHIAKIASKTGLHISSHDLRRSFSTLAEWPGVSDGVIKQIIGHKPGNVTEAHYKPRPLDLLRLSLQRYEDFILEEANRVNSSDSTVIEINKFR